MGNCQAAETATVVIQHPGGRVERLYWSTSAAEVMRANPGHYVALVTLRVAEEPHDAEGGARRTVRLTRVKLLKPKETLLLGHAYRLITSQEVTKAVQARKEEKLRKAQQQLLESRQSKARAAADDDDEALDESLDQMQLWKNHQNSEHLWSEAHYADSRRRCRLGHAHLFKLLQMLYQDKWYPLQEQHAWEGVVIRVNALGHDSLTLK